MRFLLIGLTIVLLSLATACSELRLTKPPEPTVTASITTDAQNRPEQERATIQPSDEEVAQAMANESDLPAQLIEDLKSILATETGVPSYEILFVAAEAVEWSDACLGLAQPDELCAQVITPGYRVVLSTLDREFVFHTDRSGKNMRRKFED